jgi:hypothetical protein
MEKVPNTDIVRWQQAGKRRADRVSSWLGRSSTTSVVICTWRLADLLAKVLTKWLSRDSYCNHKPQHILFTLCHTLHSISPWLVLA